MFSGPAPRISASSFFTSMLPFHGYGDAGSLASGMDTSVQMPPAISACSRDVVK